MDATGARRMVPGATVRALIDVLRAGDPEAATGGPVVVAPGDRLPAAERIELEDGGEMRAPAGCRGIPFGYHRLVSRRGPSRRLIVSPRRCPEPPHRAWGWAAQLYAVRSARSWGMGDLADLRVLARWAGGAGAGFMLLNPLHAPLPQLPQQPSPYFPSSRVFRNPLYIRVAEVPGARGDPAIASLAARGEALNRRRVIDRDRIWRLKVRALERLWRRFPGSPAFDEFRERGGEALLRYAWFCVLAEERGAPWSAWPDELRRPEARGVQAVLGRSADRIAFHCWLQWLVDRQLERAACQVGLIHDLAIGVDPAGADAWLWQDAVLAGVRVGAPPDEFAAGGQDWGLPPFHPQRLRALDYEPFIATLRGTFRHGAGLRVDHVMGLFRLWWIPPGHSARDGAYVRYPAREMLDILALEAHRAGAYVVGEDLGTVEPSVRAEMRRRRILSYRLAWFEDAPPRRFPPFSMAALTTHDLPTAAGLWTGSDLRERERSGQDVNREAEARVLERMRALVGGDAGAPPERIVERAYAGLAQAPSRLVAATLDDAALAHRRPNLPGAVGRPNWSLPLPRTLEQLRRDRVPRRIAGVLGGTR